MPAKKLLPALILALPMLVARPALAGGGMGGHLALNFPVGGFASQEGAYGKPDAGFGLGLDGNAEILPTVHWIASCGFLFNSLTASDSIPDIQEMGSHLNIPLFMGLRVLTHPKGPRARGYFQVEGGLNLSSVTDIQTNTMQNVITDWSSAFGYGLGAGVMYRLFDAGVRVYSLGEGAHRYHMPHNFVEGTSTWTPAMISVILGLHFGA